MQECFHLRAFIAVMVVGALTAGCAPRLLSVDEASPAQLLTYPGANPVCDGRLRFRQMVSALAAQRSAAQGVPFDGANLLWRMADEKASSSPAPPLPVHDPNLRILIVPGAFAECFPEYGMPYAEAAFSLRKRGYRIDFIPVSGRSGADHNAAQIAEAVEKILADDAEPIVLIGHSKGAVDILHFLVNHPQAARRVRAVVSVAGPINGSPLAEYLAGPYKTLFSRMPFADCSPGDKEVVSSLTRSYRMTWLASHRLPESVKFFSLGAFAQREDIHPLMRFTYDWLSAVEPRNDGYVAFSDQVIPGSTLLGYANLDHWDIALPIREDLNFGGANSRAPARELLFEAMVLTLIESLHQQAP